MGMAIYDTTGLSAYWLRDVNYSGWIDPGWMSLLNAYNRKTHRAFLDLITHRPLFVLPDPLPIVMRAVNGIRQRFTIRQPRWSARRWKSKT